MSIERELLKNWTETTYQEPDVQLAAGPAETVTDTGPAFTMPGMGKRSQKSEVGQNLPVLAADAAAGAGKGLVSGTLGFFGDIESLYQGVKGIINRGGDETVLNSFIKGMAEQTIMPTSDDVSKWLDANVGPVVPPNAGTGPGMQKYRETAANVGEFAGQVVADPAIAVKATKFATGVLKGMKSVKANDIPALFSHGTSEAAAESIMKSGKFDVSNAERQYTYSQFGRQAAYLTPEKGWWLDAERAANSRAITYPSAVDAKIDPKAKIVRIDSEQELNQLAKKAGFVDAYDMMKSLDVESIDYIQESKKAKSMTFDEYLADKRKDWPDMSESSIREHYNSMQTFEERAFGESDKATKQLIDAGIDGIYISDKFAPTEYENWHPASDQLAMFRPELIKPVGKRSLKNSTSSTIPTSQQEPK